MSEQQTSGAAAIVFALVLLNPTFPISTLQTVP